MLIILFYITSRSFSRSIFADVVPLWNSTIPNGNGNWTIFKHRMYWNVQNVSTFQRFDFENNIFIHKLSIILNSGVGYAIIMVNFLCTCYYSAILSYPILFITRIFTPELPWVRCGHEWNTDKCVDVMNVRKLDL